MDVGSMFNQLKNDVGGAFNTLGTDVHNFVTQPVNPSSWQVKQPVITDITGQDAPSALRTFAQGFLQAPQTTTFHGNEALLPFSDPYQVGSELGSPLGPGGIVSGAPQFASKGLNFLSGLKGAATTAGLFAGINLLADQKNTPQGLAFPALIGGIAGITHENPETIAGGLNKAKEIGEQALSPETLAKIVPEYTTPQGKSFVDGILARAQSIKPQLDNLFQGIAKQVGGNEPDFTQQMDAYSQKPFSETAGDFGVSPFQAAQMGEKTPIQQAVKDFISQPKQKQYLAEGPQLNKMTTDDGEVLNPSSPYFNVKRLNISPESQQATKEMTEALSPELRKITGGVLSNKDIATQAQTIQQIQSEITTRRDTVDKLSNILALRQKLANLAQDGTLTKDYIDTLKAVKSQATDAGRTLQSFAINADPESRTMMGQMINAVLKVSDDTDAILQKAKSVDFNNPIEATAFYRSFISPKFGEWNDLLRYGSMLSSPITTLVKTQADILNSLITNPLTKGITAGLDFIRAGITGSSRKAFFSDVPHYYEGYVRAFGDAAKDFGDVMRGVPTGYYLDEPRIPLATKGVGRIIEASFSTPTRVLEGVTRFFQTLIEEGEKSVLYGHVDKGILPDNPTLIEDMARERSAYTIYVNKTNRLGQGTFLDAVDHATNVISAARSSDNPIVSNIAKFTIPFLRIPMNLLKQGLEYNPVTGPLTLFGNVNKEQQLAKIIIGSSAMAGIAGLMGSGRLTAGIPNDPRTRSAFYKAGMQPYSVKVGNTWIAFNKFPAALSFPMGIMASIDQAMQEGNITGKTGDVLLNALAKFGGFVTDQSYLKTIGDIYGGLSGDIERTAPKIVSNYLSQEIPFKALLGWLNKMNDPILRRVNTDASFAEQVIQNTIAQIPGLSQNVSPRLDLSGNPIKSSEPQPLESFSPYKLSVENPEGTKQYQYDLLRQFTFQKILSETKGATPQETLQKRQALQDDFNEYQSIKQKLTMNPNDSALRKEKADFLVTHPAFLDAILQINRVEVQRTGGVAEPLSDFSPTQQKIILNAQKLPPNDPYAKQLKADNPELFTAYYAKEGKYLDYLAKQNIQQSPQGAEKYQAPPQPSQFDPQGQSGYVQKILDEAAKAKAAGFSTASYYNDPYVQKYLEANRDYQNQELQREGYNQIDKYGNIIPANTLQSLIAQGVRPSSFIMPSKGSGGIPSFVKRSLMHNARSLSKAGRYKMQKTIQNMTAVSQGRTPSLGGKTLSIKFGGKGASIPKRTSQVLSVGKAKPKSVAIKFPKQKKTKIKLS